MWTERRIAKLKSLWAEGLSASQIAAEIGDVSRNAVIGKVHRLGLGERRPEMIDSKDLIATIDDFLKRHKMREYKFSLSANGTNNFVFQIRNCKKVYTTTYDKAMKFMEDYDARYLDN